MHDMSIDSTQLFVKDRVQTFIDNVVIESVQNAARRWHTPARREESPVISKDRPWEYIAYFSGSDYTVLRDPEDGLFKCWYMDLDQSPQYTGSTMGTVVHPGGARQCYAASEDGVHWVKPELDVYEEDGRRTNIVMGGSGYGGAHALSVVIDPHARTRDERFRAVFTHLMRGGDGRQQSRIECARSPDGIHWQVYDELPSFGMAGPHLGDVSVVVYDEDSREFVHNTRHPMQQASFGVNPRIPRNASFFSPYQPHDFASYNKRRIFQCRSHDFIHWSEPVLVAAPDDDEDNLDESFYGMAQYKLGTVHLATVAVLRGVDNEMHVQLMVSRDGTRWSRTNKRQPFLAPRDGHWDAHMVSMVSPPIDVGDETWFYHGGTDFHHDWWMFGAAEGMDHPEARSALGGSWGLGLATLRRDGYAGLYATRHREGIVVTRPVVSLGTKLEINARCEPGGSVRVEVAGHDDEVVEPCSKERSDPFTGDSVRHTVTWAGDPAIPTTAGYGTWRKLRFYLRDAELFSFRFTDPLEEQGRYSYNPPRLG